MAKLVGTKYGFEIEMPNAVVTVDNIVTFKTGTKRETHVLSISSRGADGHRRDIEVYVTRGGRMRVFDRTNAKNIREMLAENADVARTHSAEVGDVKA